MSTVIPTQADFQLLPARKLDPERWFAWEHFGGRSLDEAYAVFRQNPQYYQEDLMWMAAKPFCFYLPVALRYLQSEDSSGDNDIVNILAADVEQHFMYGEDISAAFPCVLAICNYVLLQYSKFDVNEEIYGDLRPKYEGLKRMVAARDAAPNGGSSLQNRAP